MNLNTAAQNQGVVAWASAISNHPIDIRRHTNFAFTFRVTSDIVADAVFEFAAAPPSDDDPCVPAAQYKVKEVLTCVASWGAVPTNDTFVTIPAGTKKGAICTATLPCRPDAFIQVEPASGDTGKVEVTAILSGPK